jgi:hypothetical protein
VKVFGLVALVVIALITAGCSHDDRMNTQRRWCHDQGGYIANTGWYEWKCIINGNPVYMPSPRDG